MWKVYEMIKSGDFDIELIKKDSATRDKRGID